MLRTRDFVLVLTIIGFLLVSVGATYFSNSEKTSKTYLEPKFVETELRELEVELYEPETFSREENIESLRKKIAEQQGDDVEILVTLNEEQVAEKPKEGGETKIETELEKVVLVDPQYCSDYTEYQGVWSPYGILFDVAEGARVVYRESISEYDFNSNATSGEKLPPQIKRDIIMELPAYPIVEPESRCLSSDVIGIANDGSLIKNSEANLYSIFGSETLLGYALDGYPIYGKSEEETGECGWGMVNNNYGYYLSSAREVVLNCFTGTPISTSFLY